MVSHREIDRGPAFAGATPSQGVRNRPDGPMRDNDGATQHSGTRNPHSAAVNVTIGSVKGSRPGAEWLTPPKDATCPIVSGAVFGVSHGALSEGLEAAIRVDEITR